jgi:hypothetical protein
MSDTRRQLELSVLEIALREVIHAARTCGPSFTTLDYIANRAQSALDIVSRSQRQAARRRINKGEPDHDNAGAPQRPANVIPFDLRFREKHKDPGL